jgi:uncharacterized membrane protein YeaQ/YmgE (transglycosylase-associated protein family)
VDIVAAILGLALGGLVIGALARLAVPGPDPMPLWTTVLLGAVGAIVGGTAGYALLGQAGYFLGAVVLATLLVIGYRRVFQKRGVTGPESRRRPGRGFGIRRRTRDQQIAELAQLRDEGVLTEEEFQAKRAGLIAGGPGR